jgi:hypothetical protein
LRQRPAQVLVEGDRRVGGRVDAAGDARVDLPERDLVRDEDRRLEPEARDETVERGREHVLVRGLRVGAVRAGEGDAVAAQDGDPAGGWRHRSPLRSITEVYVS